ncbi:MAG TPA: RsmE family RNA methyltransferase, partial [Bacillota bacterium]
MHRFFIDPADLESAGGGGSRVIFHPDQVRQMKRVLRLRPGDSVAAVLPGREIVVRLEGGGSGELSGGGPVMEDRPGLPLAPIAVDLYQALAKGDRFESVLQKGTELGVARVVPVLTDRTVARPDPERVQGRVVRWRAVAREAAEQCGRSDEPVIEAPADWAGVCAEAGRADLAVVPWEREEATALVEVLRAFAGRLGGLADGGRAAVQPAVGPVARPRVAVIIG